MELTDYSRIETSKPSRPSAGYENFPQLRLYVNKHCGGLMMFFNVLKWKSYLAQNERKFHLIFFIIINDLIVLDFLKFSYEFGCIFIQTKNWETSLGISRSIHFLQLLTKTGGLTWYTSFSQTEEPFIWEARYNLKKILFADWNKPKNERNAKAYLRDAQTHLRWHRLWLDKIRCQRKKQNK